jgi:hypothetical protein
MNDAYSNLDQLPSKLRIAFAAGCASRVLIIYEYFSDVYHYGPQKAVQLAWAAAEGASVSDQKIKTVSGEVDKALPDLDVSGPQYTPALYAGEAAGLALDAIKDNTADSARKAAIYALGAIKSLEEGREEGVKEEERWQQHALRELAKWGQRAPAKDMFENIGTSKPEWLSRFED